MDEHTVNARTSLGIRKRRDQVDETISGYLMITKLLESRVKGEKSRYGALRKWGENIEDYPVFLSRRIQ